MSKKTKEATAITKAELEQAKQELGITTLPKGMEKEAETLLAWWLNDVLKPLMKLKDTKTGEVINILQYAGQRLNSPKIKSSNKDNLLAILLNKTIPTELITSSIKASLAQDQEPGSVSGNKPQATGGVNIFFNMPTDTTAEQGTLTTDENGEVIATDNFNLSEYINNGNTAKASKTSNITDAEVIDESDSTDKAENEE